jgi:hypothetical protein
MDDILHGERLEGRPRRKRTFRARPAILPDGVLVRAGDSIAMVAGDKLLPWSTTGYGRAARATTAEVDVLTPRTIVDTIAAGYRPLCHPSAAGTARNLRIHGQPVG